MTKQNWRERAIQSEARIVVLQQTVIEYADRLIELQRPRVIPKINKPDPPDEKGQSDD
jgi:hypothetical protein